MNAQNLRLQQLEEHSRRTEAAYALRLNEMEEAAAAEKADLIANFTGEIAGMKA